MSQVRVEINKKSYRLTCGEGEEDHVQALSHRIDAIASGMGKSSNPGSESQTLVMTALMLADELEESQTRVEALESQIAQLKGAGLGGAPDERIAEMEHAVADMLDKAAAQIEAVVMDLEEVL